MANYELSNRIYELRTQKGLSQKELGAILGVSNKAVSKWETGTAIPKTETLIKLAEVFEISTEELLNMALPLQNTPPVVEQTISYPTNARIGKTLSEFRAEYGLYLKDVAERINVDESELQAIEDSNLVPYEIANRLVIAYGLPTNDFARPIFKSKTVTKKYLLKKAFIYEIILGFVGAIPMFIGGILVTLATLFDSSALEEASTYMGDLYYLIHPIAAMVGGILLGKYLTEKSGYFGDFNRYRFLYAAVPVAASVVLNALLNLILGLTYNYLRENPDGIKNTMLLMLRGATDLLLSVASMAVIVGVLAMLMNVAIEQNPETRRKILKKIAIAVTISSILAYIIVGITDYIMHDGYFFKPIKDFLFYGVDIAIVWLTYSITESNPKKEKWAFVILPIISLWEIIITDIFTLIF